MAYISLIQAMGRHYLLITQTILMIMGGVRELLLFVMTVGVVKGWFTNVLFGLKGFVWEICLTL